MKRPGLIRWNFFVYFVVIFGLGFAYIFLGLDGHVKRLIEHKLSAFNGAPVTIEHATFKLSGPRIELEKLEFKDPSHPERNHFEIGKVHLELEWQALLRNRLVITDSFASNAILYPLQPLAPFDAQIKSLVAPPKSNSLASASDFLSNPSRTQLPSDDVWTAVPSFQATKALNSELDTQVAAWTKQVDALLETDHQQIDASKAAQTQDSEAQNRIILGQLEKSRLELNQLQAQVKADGNVILSKVETLTELLPHDVTVIRQGVKLPNLEFNQLAAELGAQQTRAVIDIADSFHYRLIPWLEKKEQALADAHGRNQGTEFYFSGRLLPPRLWIKKLELTSKDNTGSGAGDVIGRISDLSSEPSEQPAHMSLQASFSKAEISNVQLEAQIDHRGGLVDDRLALNVASFPVRDLDFVNTPALRMGIEQATATLNLEYLAQKDSTVVNAHNKLDKVSYRIESTGEPIKKVFDDALSPLTSLELDANGQGKTDNLQWTYTSNLSDRLRSALQQVLSQEYAEFNARIRERADQKVRDAKKAMETRLVTESDAVQQKIAVERDEIQTMIESITKKK
ncbi:MAG: hypothetical protein H7249_06450 [Chitinophagaceae bacterium]|nr:hypothetical protein [Oligoflexus sp.]